MTDDIHRYLLEVTLAEPDVLRELREETDRLPGRGMQIAPEQGNFMALLVELIGARRSIEIGVFTGYSSIAVALVLPADGKLVACDVNEEWMSIARRYWKKAGVLDKIQPELRPALSTLDELIGSGEAGRYDFAFIDADKENNDAYYERCLTLIRQGGLIAIDNSLWAGSVADPNNQSHDTRAIRALNQKLRDDARVTTSLVPIGDGLFLARKR
jgi:caffeoyl-CoA O-methyltransferase